MKSDSGCAILSSPTSKIISRVVIDRYGVNSIPELMGNSKIACLKQNGINKFGIGICYKKFYPQINFFNSEIFLP